VKVISNQWSVISSGARIQEGLGLDTRSICSRDELRRRDRFGSPHAKGLLFFLSPVHGPNLAWHASSNVFNPGPSWLLDSGS
jgi:hypothetical protein